MFYILTFRTQLQGALQDSSGQYKLYQKAIYWHFNYKVHTVKTLVINYYQLTRLLLRPKRQEEENLPF